MNETFEIAHTVGVAIMEQARISDRSLRAMPARAGVMLVDAGNGQKRLVEIQSQIQNTGVTWVNGISSAQMAPAMHSVGRILPKSILGGLRQQYARI